MLILIFLSFTVYSSFSFPALISDDGEAGGLSSVPEGAGNIAFAEEPDIDPADFELLEDDDVLFGGEELPGAYNGLGKKQDGSELSGTADPQAGQEPVEFSRDDWRLILINKQHSIPDDYAFTLGTVKTLKGARQCDERIIEELLDMKQAAEEDGIRLEICSPYRDLEYQKMLFNRKIKHYMNRGMSYLEAYQISSQTVTVPGASEHQIGLALDIVSDTYQNLDWGFGETPAGIWLAENCCKYGFILRYPLGKEDITGIEYEPWHFRYVGVEAATVITEAGITLEEFWEDYL